MPLAARRVSTERCRVWVRILEMFAVKPVLLALCPAFQKGAHCQAGPGGKAEAGCCSAGSGIWGSDGGEPDAEDGPVSVCGTTGKTQNPVSEEARVLLTLADDEMWAYKVAGCYVLASKICILKGQRAKCIASLYYPHGKCLEWV